MTTDEAKRLWLRAKERGLYFSEGNVCDWSEDVDEDKTWPGIVLDGDLSWDEMEAVVHLYREGVGLGEWPHRVPGDRADAE